MLSLQLLWLDLFFLHRARLINFIFTVFSALRSAGGVLFFSFFAPKRREGKEKNQNPSKNSVQFISGTRSVHTVINCSVCSRFVLFFYSCVLLLVTVAVMQPMAWLSLFWWCIAPTRCPIVFEFPFFVCMAPLAMSLFIHPFLTWYAWWGVARVTSRLRVCEWFSCIYKSNWNWIVAENREKRRSGLHYVHVEKGTVIRREMWNVVCAMRRHWESPKQIYRSLFQCLVLVSRFDIN